MQGVSRGKYCDKHGIEKTYWKKDPKMRDGGLWICPKCNYETNARYRATPRGTRTTKTRCWRTQGIEGITYEQYSAVATHCRICGSTERLVPDHDHATKQFRGVLCGRCNSMLGFARDNPVILRCGELYLGGQPCH